MGNTESGLGEEFGEPFKIVIKPKGYTRKDTNRLNPYAPSPKLTRHIYQHDNDIPSRNDSNDSSPSRNDSGDSGGVIRK